MWVANTDLDWFDYLSAQPEIDEVNFWQPSGETKFNAVQPGELFLFKLKSPRNVIGGFGVLSQSSNLPLSLAWEAFGAKNGAASFDQMRQRVGQYRRDERPHADYTIGCRVVVQPVFLPERLWVPQPASWAKSIVVGKTYDTVTVEGLRLWEQIQAAAASLRWAKATATSSVRDERTLFDFGPRFGTPTLVEPRLGQGAFRLAVTDAYSRQCGISGGRVLPALDAAHIKPYAQGGGHELSNGILLRRDIHSVFDAGYATFDEQLRLVVSDRVRTDFNNGNEYRRLHGAQLQVPAHQSARPSESNLTWHRETIFLG